MADQAKTLKAHAANGKVTMSREDFETLLILAGAQVTSTALEIKPKPKKGPKPGFKRKPLTAAAATGSR